MFISLPLDKQKKALPAITNFSGYIYRMATNFAINHLKRNKTEVHALQCKRCCTGERVVGVAGPLRKRIFGLFNRSFFTKSDSPDVKALENRDTPR